MNGKRKIVLTIVAFLLILCVVVPPVFGQIRKSSLLGTTWTFTEDDMKLTIQFSDLDVPVEGMLAFIFLVNGESLTYGSVVIDENTLLLRIHGLSDWAMCTINGKNMFFRDINGNEATFIKD